MSGDTSRRYKVLDAGPYDPLAHREGSVGRSGKCSLHGCGEAAVATMTGQDRSGGSVVLAVCERGVEEYDLRGQTRPLSAVRPESVAVGADLFGEGEHQLLLAGAGDELQTGRRCADHAKRHAERRQAERHGPLSARLPSDIQRLVADLRVNRKKVHLTCKDLIAEIKSTAGTGAPFW
jgi:hypothetical protein